jgi:RNA polymerase sigma factor (sigma-70 family)
VWASVRECPPNRWESKVGAVRRGNGVALAKSRTWNRCGPSGKLAVMRPSFDAAFAAEFGPLYAYLRRRVDAKAAEDLAAATFATAYANWDRYDPVRPVRPWLYGIAANLVRHHWRKERRMLRAYARTGVDPVLSPDDEADDRIEAQALRRELSAALAELRPQEREILLLHAWAGLTDREIAAALSLPLGTVKSRLHRTRERLRNRLDPTGQSHVKAVIATSEERR